MKKFINTTLSLALTVSLLAACGTSTTPADDGVNEGTTEVTTSVNDDDADDNNDDDNDDDQDDVSDGQSSTDVPVEIDYQALDRQVDRDEDLIDIVFDNLEDDRIDDIDEVTEIASLLFLNADILGQADAQDAFATLRENPRDYKISHDGEWYLVTFGDLDTLGFRFNDNSTVDVTVAGQTTQEGLDLVELANAEFERGLSEDLLEDFAELLEDNFEIDHQVEIFD